MGNETMQGSVAGGGELSAASEEALALCASAYEFLTFSLRYPDDELAQAISSGEWVAAAREIASALGLALPESWDAQLDACEGVSADEVRHVLRVEATRLFVGAPEPRVSPYEGVWRATDEGVQALLFVNPHSMAVERFMRSCGFGRVEGANDPIDRVDAEFEFLQNLCMLACGMTAPVTGQREPEDGWVAAHDRFCVEHVLTWVPRFSDRLAQETREPFYRAVAQLMKAVVGLGRLTSFES